MKPTPPFRLSVRLGQLSKQQEALNAIEYQNTLEKARGYDFIIKSVVHDILTRAPEKSLIILS